MKLVAMEGVAPFLPQEIILNLLKMLPVKSLIRLQCVCKHWRNLIKSPSFIAAHLDHSTQHRPCLLFRSYGSHEHLELSKLDCDMQTVEVQNIPKVWIAGSSNGLLCLRMHRYSYGISPPPPLLLWNPALRKVRHVPTSGDASGDFYYEYYIGFGFSPVVNDYKIVRLDVSIYSFQVQYVEVYSLGVGLWKNIEVGNLEGLILMQLRMGFTMNGAIFWFATQDILHGAEYVIVSFDIAMEIFSLISVPAINLIEGRTSFTEFEHRLALLCSTLIEDPESCLIEVWVLEDGTDGSGEKWSWVKKYTSSPHPCLLLPKTIWRNEIACIFQLLPGEEDTEFIERTVMSNFTNTGLKVLFDHYTYIFNYVESLVPVSNTHIEEF